MLLSIVQLSVYAIRTAWQEETVLRTKMALAALHRLVVVYRYADIVRAYLFFMNAGEESSQYCVCVATPTNFVSLHIFPTSFC